MVAGTISSNVSVEDIAYARLLAYIKTEMPSYIIGKHHKLIAHYLQKLESGEITRLAIFMPPRHGKTMLASEFFSAWYMGRNPTHEVILASYAQDRSDDVGKTVRNLMLSENYGKIFPDSVLRPDAKGTRKFQTKKGGSFFSVGWGGAVTGRGANCALGEERILTDQGSVKIEDLHNKKSSTCVLSLNHRGKPCYSKVTKSVKITGAKVYEISTKSGRKLRATADHRVYSRIRGFVKFKNLKVGEELVCHKPQPNMPAQTKKSGNQKAGQRELCLLRGKTNKQNNKTRIVSNKSGYSSYRSEPQQQPAREFGDTLQQMPLCSSSFETDVVSMAPRLYSESDTVYDIRVERTHNYFAEGILSHNCLILDDLIKDRADALSETNRRKREDWFSSTAYTRLMADEGSDEGRILLIMTRWAYNDIAAYLLNELAHEKWHILNCPAVAEERDILGRYPGDALWPEKYNAARLAKIKQSVQLEDWESLYMQRPLPKEGGMVKLHWFGQYDPHKMRHIEDVVTAGGRLAEEFDWFSKIVLSLDTGYKPNQINDPSALTVWGYNKNRQYLIESATERLEFPQLKQWVMRFWEKYRRWNMGPVPLLIEDAASGQSLIQVLRQETNIPVVAIYPDKSKTIRMEHVSDYIASGRVLLPERAPWLTDFQTQIVQFPYGVHDDLCDSMSQYLKWVYKPRRRRPKQKMFFK